MNPTAEQQNVIDTFRTMSDQTILIVQAGAGCGKTATLLECAKSTKTHGIYSAFNRGIVEDGRGKFPGHIECRTMHAAAMAAMRDARPDLMRQFDAKAKPKVDITGPIEIDGTRFAEGWLISQTLKTVERFCQTDSSSIELWHMPIVKKFAAAEISDDGETILRRGDAEKELWRTIGPAANQLWKRIERGESVFGFAHYLKMAANFDLDFGYRLWFWDEAQDTAPVMEQILVNQLGFGASIVAVGDSAQSINGFTGAVDSLERLGNRKEALPALALTESFRFGPEIAEVAQRVLDLGYLNTRISGVGGPSKLAPIRKPNAVLCRTNAGVMKTILGFLDDGFQVSAPKRVVDDLTRFCGDAAKLVESGEGVGACEGFSSWSDFMLWTETDPIGEDYRVLAKLVDSFGHHTLLNALRELARPGKNVVHILTAHTSKGLEWDHVQIGDDWRTPSDLDKLDTETAKLVYVAVTRARETLDVSLMWLANVVA